MSEASGQPEAAEYEQVVNQTVFVGGRNVPFGELTVDDVRRRADELRAAVGFGPTARIAPVAMAWREFVMAMEKAGVATAGELTPEVVVPLAQRMWVVAPSGGLI